MFKIDVKIAFFEQIRGKFSEKAFKIDKNIAFLNTSVPGN
jgi:hypothetical protein